MRREWRSRWLVGVWLLAFLGAGAAASAEGTSPPAVDVLFGDPFAGDDWFSLDEAELFGGGLVTDAEASGQSLEEVFLVRDTIDVGGSYRASLSTSWLWLPGGESPAQTGWSLNAGGTLFLDARPSRDWRFFGKARVDGSWLDHEADLTVALHELFVDFVAAERAFFRVGRQLVKWGVGYFFSPADVINAGRIDPSQPDAEREGATALRVHVPSGRQNWYGYILVEGDGVGGYRIAVAPKVEWVAGGTEVGVGLFYQPERVPRLMATVSTTVGRLAVFGEAMVSKGSDKRFAVATTPTWLNPLGLDVVEDKDTLFVQATAGARGSYSQPGGRFRVTAAAQYFYNGEGYEAAFLREHGAKLPALYLLGHLSAADVQWPGRHYAALLASASHRSLKDVAVSALWLGNLTDGSGTASVTLSYTGWASLRPSITISRLYGSPGSQFAPAGPVASVAAGIGFSAEF